MATTKKKLKREIITVTRADIKAGNRKNPDCRNCPIALAVRRIHPAWAVGREKLFDYLSMETITTLPRRAQKFIDDFESGNKVAPFKFAILLPVQEEHS